MTELENAIQFFEGWLDNYYDQYDAEYALTPEIANTALAVLKSKEEEERHLKHFDVKEPRPNTYGDLIRASDNNAIAGVIGSIMFGVIKRTLEILGLGDTVDLIPRDVGDETAKQFLDTVIQKEVQ